MKVLYLELQKLAAPTGHEPAPSSVTGKCSTLSYGTMNHIAEAKKGLEPSTGQTLLQLLYLIELQSHSTMQKFAIHRYHLRLLVCCYRGTNTSELLYLTQYGFLAHGKPYVTPMTVSFETPRGFEPLLVDLQSTA